MRIADGQTTATTPFGGALRHWRRVRGFSQLHLAGIAGTTPRHLSFLETGRSRPSGDMVDRLGDALDLPLRERNQLMELAGMAARYPEGDLSADDLAPFQRVVEQMLRQHAPYPAFVVDRRWMVVAINGPAQLLVPAPGPNAVDLFLDSWWPIVENAHDVAVALVDRLARDLLRFPDDEALRGLHGRVRAAVGGHVVPEGRTGRVVCPRFRIGDQVVRTLTVVARFESAVDVTLDELRVELVYPEDEASEAFFRAQPWQADAPVEWAPLDASFPT